MKEWTKGFKNLTRRNNLLGRGCSPRLGDISVWPLYLTDSHLQSLHEARKTSAGGKKPLNLILKLNKDDPIKAPTLRALGIVTGTTLPSDALCNHQQSRNIERSVGKDYDFLLLVDHWRKEPLPRALKLWQPRSPIEREVNTGSISRKEEKEKQRRRNQNLVNGLASFNTGDCIQKAYYPHPDTVYYLESGMLYTFLLIHNRMKTWYNQQRHPEHKPTFGELMQPFAWRLG